MEKNRTTSYAVIGSLRKKISTPLPFYPHATGHVRCFMPFYSDLPPRERPFVELYWCISGSGRFYMEDGSFEIVHPGDVFFRLENERHRHEILEEPWEYRWLTFEGELAEAHLRAYQYPHRSFYAGPCPQELYLRLENLIREDTDYCYRESVAVISSILARAGGNTGKQTLDAGLVGKAKDVCSLYYQDPSFDINTLSSILKVSRWSLRRAFQRHLNIAPHAFLMNMRLDRAIKRLKNTRDPIARVARESGFADTCYFCKIIRETTGYTPSALRKF